MVMKNKKGQIAIFVIIGIVIVAAIVLFFLVRNNTVEIPFVGQSGEFDFREELRNCIKNNKIIDDKIEKIANQGGKYIPENYFLYNNTKIEYLCKTTEYYQTCFMQQPLVLQYVENEVKRETLQEVKDCVKSTKESAEKRGYEVTTGDVE